jgi:hypothetical protein
MRVLVTGDRHWTDQELIAKALSGLTKDDTVIHGGAKGADTLAGKVAFECGLTVEEFKADWDKYGRAAGPIRNKRMLERGKPDLVFAFHSDIRKSKGTKDMITRALLANLSVRLYDGSEVYRIINSISEFNIVLEGLNQRWIDG